MSEKNPVLPPNNTWDAMTKEYEKLREKAISSGQPVKTTRQFSPIPAPLIQGSASDLVFGHNARNRKVVFDTETAGMVPGAVPIMSVHDEVIATVPVVHDIMPDFAIQFESEAAALAAHERAKREGLESEIRRHYCLMFRVPKDFATAMALRGLLMRTRADWRSAGPECPGSHGPMSGFERTTQDLESWHCRIRPTCIRTIPKDGRQISVNEFQQLTSMSSRYCEEEKEEKYGKQALALLKKRNETMTSQRTVRQAAKSPSFSDPSYGYLPPIRNEKAAEMVEAMMRSFPAIGEYMSLTGRSIRDLDVMEELQKLSRKGGPSLKEFGSVFPKMDYASLEKATLAAIGHVSAQEFQQLAEHSRRLTAELEKYKSMLKTALNYRGQDLTPRLREEIEKWRSEPMHAPVEPVKMPEDADKRFWDDALVRNIDKGLRFLAGLNLQDHSIAEQREREVIVRELMSILSMNDPSLGKADRKGSGKRIGVRFEKITSEKFAERKP